MEKVEVNGDYADPLWEYIKEQRPGILGMKRVYNTHPTFSFINLAN
jgi:glutathione peroxidase-family protein